MMTSRLLSFLGLRKAAAYSFGINQTNSRQAKEHGYTDTQNKANFKAFCQKV